MIDGEGNAIDPQRTVAGNRAAKTGPRDGLGRSVAEKFHDANVQVAFAINGATAAGKADATGVAAIGGRDDVELEGRSEIVRELAAERRAPTRGDIDRAAELRGIAGEVGVHRIQVRTRIDPDRAAIAAGGIQRPIVLESAVGDLCASVVLDEQRAPEAGGV